MKVSLRRGLSANSRQIRLTVARLRPLVSAIERVLYCVAPRGSDSSVRVTTRSTSSSLTVRGAGRQGLVQQAVAAARQELSPPLTDGCAGRAQGRRHRILEPERLDDEAKVRAYKGLARVERAFRSIKSLLAPLLFVDEDKAEGPPRVGGAGPALGRRQAQGWHAADAGRRRSAA